MLSNYRITKFLSPLLISGDGESTGVECFEDLIWRKQIFNGSDLGSVGGNALKILGGKVSAEYDFMDDNIENGYEAEPTKNSKAKVSPVTKDVDTSAYGTTLHVFPLSLEIRD